MKLLLSFLLLPTLTWQLSPPDPCPPPLLFLSPSNAAPNDEASRCLTDPQYAHTYPSTTTTKWRVLMDSINYLELIDDRDGVWQRLDADNTSTVWQQAGGICAHEVSVCEIGTNRNNWFFTQYILYRDAKEVNVSVTYAFTGCISEFGCQSRVTFYRYERDDPNVAAARDPNNYDQLEVVTGPSGFGINLGNTNFSFQPSSNSRGFYIGVQDTGSCVSIRRLILYYNVSAGGTEDVTVIPEIALPPQGSTDTSTGIACCLDNAVPAPGTTLEIECDANGVCTDPECVCRRGYEFTTANGEAECRVCPPGTYQANDTNDFSCEPCPANSEARDPASAECPCLFNFNRPPGQPNETCTRPPSSPRVAINNPPTVSGTSITVCWLPSNDTGGRSDLRYDIYLLRFGGGSNAYQRVATVNSNTSANPNTPIYRSIGNMTPGTSYSVVITAANGATDDPESFTDISVVQDRFLVFYVATCDDDGPRSPSSLRFSTTTPPIISNTSITIFWLPSLDNGGGSDLHYIIYLLQYGDDSNAYQRIMRVNSSNDADLNTPLSRTIQDLTPETSYSVVITAANNVTMDLNSLTDVSVVQDRFIAFYFETREDEEPSVPPSPSPSVPSSPSPSTPPSPSPSVPSSPSPSTPPPTCPSSPTESTEEPEDEGLQLDLVIGVLIFAILVTAIATTIITLLIAWCVHKRSMSKYDVLSRKKNGATSGSSFKKSPEVTNPAYGY